jgi:hypothetical protein
MIKKVAMSEIGISIKGLIAINQFLKKKKIRKKTNQYIEAYFIYTFK